MPFSATYSRSSNLSKLLVCVDVVENREPRGFFYSPYLDGPVPYDSAVELINRMDDFFDRFGFPQAYNEYRSFYKNRVDTPAPINLQEATQYMKEDELFESKAGEKATFVVQVQFRQNSTWQGTVTWTEQKMVQRFRSTLEMIKLMDSALAAQPGEDCTDWDKD